ncbi:OsmC family protein [Lutimaribacter saemankumensis]|uniref:OsmC-like protein n=1 Tax=Lutimaribacter saemankumensis TaxID=490829 RepID=A0A1G8TV14_9RHOB|nr:OsmC family protein [Lutimaribacter saemankumensis]SDJ45352.1 OsmC-like protein [Lutimaribacter saemankumensis]
MDRDTHAREAQLRAISIYTQRPERAQVVHRGSAAVRDGLSCTYEQDGHRLTLDMPNAIGGSDEGPTPGYFARAAICGCLAIGIKMTAAREGLQLHEVNVGIEQDWDNRGILAMDSVSPVPSETLIAIEITSPEPEATIRGMVTRALGTDPWFLAYRDAQPVSTAVSIVEDVT